MSFFDLFDGGASRRNKHAKKVRKIQEKNLIANYEFEWGDKDSDELGGQQKRKYDYAVEGLEILKRNTESNLDYQEKGMMQKWDHGMSVRAYEHQLFKLKLKELLPLKLLELLSHVVQQDVLLLKMC